jgi:uncharacterized protein
MTVPWTSPHPAGTVLSIWVVPGASRTEVAGTHGQLLRIRVAVPAEKGKANQAVSRLLEARLECSVRLLSGSGSRGKRFLAEGVDPGDAARLLS